MQLLERQNNFTIGYHRALSGALFGIEHCPRLSPEENTKYGEAIVLLRTELGKFGDVNAFDDGTQAVPSQAKCLFEQYRSHANALAEGNIRLINVAFRATPTAWNLPDEDLKDLAGTAQEELLRSAKNFDPWHALQSNEIPYVTRSPGQFSRYAVKNMHFKIMNVAKELGHIHIPPQRFDQYRAYWGARDELINQRQELRFETAVVMAEYKRTHEKYPTAEELREYYDQVQKSEHASKAHNGLLRNYAKTIVLLQPVSFEDMLTGKKQYRGERTGEVAAVSYAMEEVIPSADDVPEQVLAAIAVTQVLDSVWPGEESGGRMVYPRERQILEMRYGLNGQKEHTQEEVGRYYGITRSRINQLQERALKKLRDPSVMLKLQDLLA